MLELKSCPHCNGNGRIVSVSGFKSDRYRVVCEECGASTRECETKQEAVSAWNMRADGWIPVGERLPESGVHVLVACEVRGQYCSGRYVCDGFYAKANTQPSYGYPDECVFEYSEEDDEYYLLDGWYEVVKNWDDYSSIVIDDFVTHWMPLPSTEGLE